MKVNLKMECHMEMENKFIMMEVVTKVNLVKVKKMEKVNTNVKNFYILVILQMVI